MGFCVQANDCDPALSNKPFTNWNFKSLPEYDFNGKTICNSNFYNEQPNSDIFPDGMHGSTFNGCILTNVIVPDGNTVSEDCVIGSVQIQNDGEDWKVDSKTLEPIEPINKEKFVNLGISTKPEDIPKEKISEPITIKEEKNKSKENAIDEKLKEVSDLQAELEAGIQGDLVK
jgi:hypothetical protein